MRGGEPGAGGPLPGLSAEEFRFFERGAQEFGEVQSVQGTIPETEAGLGPRFNLDSCGGCHSHPAVGGSSPAVNPQVAMATAEGAANSVPWFISAKGPIREARFAHQADGRTPDGSVTNLFTIAGRSDAPGCTPAVLPQPDFGSGPNSAVVKTRGLIFRIPLQVFGTGLIESIPDSTLIANKKADAARKAALGIAGRENRSSSDGTITRFGWKAQVKSLLAFSAEAYNVEQGVTNELFNHERDETPQCLFNSAAEDITTLVAADRLDVLSSIELFAVYQRLLAPPAPAAENPSIAIGRELFGEIGCALCHTPTLMTGRSSVAALNAKPGHLYSDLLLHKMGARLADGISQGLAQGDEFRTAPLWGLGQRLFFLHDGRTSDLVQAIQEHASAGSEANAVVRNFNALNTQRKQHLLNFLRSL